MHWREKSFKSVPELPDIVNAKGQNRVMLIRVFYWILEMEKKFPRILHLEIYCLAMHMMIWLGPIKFRLVPQLFYTIFLLLLTKGAKGKEEGRKNHGLLVFHFPKCKNAASTSTTTAQQTSIHNCDIVLIKSVLFFIPKYMPGHYIGNFENVKSFQARHKFTGFFLVVQNEIKTFQNNIFVYIVVIVSYTNSHIYCSLCQTNFGFQ